MEINQVKFIKSSKNNTELPPPNRPEYAFVGRSNVGKSSLINAICRQKGLAKTSSTPGKTQLINHFDVDGRWYLVDLPGYGYAKVSKKERLRFERMIRDYCSLRPNLLSIFVLVDIRHPAQALDTEFMEFLGLTGIPFAIVFTKADKLKESEVADKVKAYEESLYETWEELPPRFVTSSEKKHGLEDLLAYMGEHLNEVGA